MAGYVILGVLAAFGALCVLWLLFGLLLPVPRGGAVVCWAARTEEGPVLRRYIWLWELGLVHWKLVLIDSRMDPLRQQQLAGKYRSIHFYTKEQWIEQEKEYLG